MSADESETRQETDTRALAEAIELMARLRGPDGCPWDREQTFDTIKRHTLEETYEVFDAIERRAWPELKDELGDLLLQVLFYARMAEEAGYFTIQEVAANLNAKLVRRHPHIFGAETAASAEDVKVHWERIKARERAARGVQEASSLLDAVPRHVPALLEAEKLGRKAAKVGFDWPDATGLFAKLAEEIGELQAEVRVGEAETEEARARVFDELGDLLFTAVHLARHLGMDAEFALRGANAKFRRRFGAMERAAGGGDSLATRSAEELEELWRAAKEEEEPRGVDAVG
jgi:XTP/dITP diphosphohydrolase/ATP diphosphatase